MCEKRLKELEAMAQESEARAERALKKMRLADLIIIKMVLVAVLSILLISDPSWRFGWLGWLFVGFAIGSSLSDVLGIYRVNRGK